MTNCTQLIRQELGGGSYKVATTNAVNGTQHYSVEFLPDGFKRRTAINGRGFVMENVSFEDEHFHPTNRQTKDGEIYLVAGKEHSSVFRLDGFTTFAAATSVRFI